eukprot:4205187-Pyramimonas_sp.AAC.1
MSGGAGSMIPRSPPRGLIPRSAAQRRRPRAAKTRQSHPTVLWNDTWWTSWARSSRATAFDRRTSRDENPFGFRLPRLSGGEADQAISRRHPISVPGGAPGSYAPGSPRTISTLESPDLRARSPRKRSTEGGGPRAPRPRSEVSDLSDLPRRSSMFRMRINAKCANVGPGVLTCPSRGASAYSAS